MDLLRLVWSGSGLSALALVYIMPVVGVALRPITRHYVLQLFCAIGTH